MREMNEAGFSHLFVRFFGDLRRLFLGKEKDLTVDDGTTVRELLGLLADRPDRRRELFPNGRVNTHLVIIRNGLPVNIKEGLDILLREDDVLSIFPYIGGGGVT